MKIVVDPKKCRTSGECMLICPENAISILDGVATIDESKCDLDGANFFYEALLGS